MSATAAVAAVPNTAAAPAAPAAAPAAAGPWYGEIPDAELKGWADNKKFASPLDALTHGRDSEKLIGVPPDQVLKLPKGDAKPEEWDSIHKRLGWPEKPEGYKVPPGVNVTDFAQSVIPLLHSARISQSQFEKLAPAWDALVNGMTQQSERELQQKITVEDQQLHRDWPGETYTQRQEMARRAFRQFSADIFDANATDADRDAVFKQFDQILGPARTMKLFAKIGESLTESNFADGNNRGPNYGTTPEGAAQRLKELHADRDWRSRRLSGGNDSAEAQEEDRLTRIVAAGRMSGARV